MAKTELTEEKIAAIKARFNEITQSAFCTDPAPREKIQQALVRIYEREGFKAPKEFIWVDSDVGAAAYIKKNSSSPYNNNMFGQYDLYWLAKIIVANEFVGGVVITEKDKAIIDDMLIMTECGPWWPYDDVVVIMDRPLEINLLPDGNLHNESGPAISYRDGVKHWYIGGHQVNERIVLHPEELTVEEIKKEQNAEVRRIMMSRYGVGKYMKETSAVIIDKDEYFNMPRILVKLDDNSRWLIGTDGGSRDENGKGRVYYMPVTSDTTTCKKAHESICMFIETAIGAQS